LRALRHSNSALIRAPDESHYLKEICQVVVRDCGYSMVWIGALKNDAEKRIVPLSGAGFEQGYLDTLNLTWADTSRGQGPFGMAVRTGQPVVADDLRTDARFALWREEALKQGYASVISLPLKSENKVLGILNIYSESPGTFTGPALPVLYDLAEDVGQGIGAFRLRKEHARAQEAMQTMSGFFKRLGDNSPDIVARRGLDRRFIYVNPALERLTGIPSSEFLGKTNEELCLSSDLCRLWEEHSNALSRFGQSSRFHFAYSSVNGKEHWFDMMLVPEFDGEGSFQSELAIGRDITEQRETQKALHESEAKFRHIFEASNEGIWLLDQDARVTLVNGRMASLLGYTGEEMRGRRKTEFVPPEDLPKVEALLARRRCGISEEADVRFQRKNGDVVWTMMSGRALLDDHGSFIGILDMISDITARKRAEDALRESEERFRLMADGTPVLIWVHDQAGRLQFVNLAYCDFFGITIDQVRNDGWHPLVHPEDLHSYAEFFSECHRQRKPFKAQARVRRSDGQWRWMESQAVPRWSASGEFLGMVGSSMDITERKDFQSELERLVAERTAALQEITDQLNGFVHTLAHDFRAPLRNQSGLAGLLLSEYGQKLGEGRQLAESLARSADRQLGMIQDLMEHVSLCRAELNLEPVPLENVVAEVRADLALEFQRTDASLELRGVDGVTVKANRAALHIVLLNFLGNALKFVKPGTRPQILVRAEFCPPLSDGREFSGSPLGSMGHPVRLWVEDNGIGISTADLDKVFGWFQRFHPSFPGSGLGLALVKKAAERMGGRVGVESVPGQGSRFWIELCAASLADSAHSTSASGPVLP
jgi:PAS domain S-box-containing protein